MTANLVGPGGSVDVTDRPERQVGQVQDRFTDLEPLADQAGADMALVFSFATPVDLIWVLCRGGEGRAHVGTDPDAAFGVPCLEDTPQPLTITTDEVRVFAALGTTVACWGYRYG